MAVTVCNECGCRFEHNPFNCNEWTKRTDGGTGFSAGTYKTQQWVRCPRCGSMVTLGCVTWVQ